MVFQNTTRAKALMNQLGENSLLDIGTVAPPIRQDAPVQETHRENKYPL